MTEPSHQVTVESGQCETHGAALEPIDMALIGDAKSVHVEKTINQKKK